MDIVILLHIKIWTRTKGKTIPVINKRVWWLQIICIRKRGLVNECHGALITHTKLGKYSLKKSNSSIFDALNT